MKPVFFVEVLAVALSLSPISEARASPLGLDVYSAKNANVNAFVVFDPEGSVIIDATRTSAEASEVARLARSHRVEPRAIFITHGHPDHFWGLGRLRMEFPKAKILVASQAVKDDIVRFAQSAAGGHWLSDETGMYPRSADHPAGFDYLNEIQVLRDSFLELPLGERLEILKMDSPTECAHETLLFSKALHALLASDIAYNGVHLWLGPGVDREAIDHWSGALERLKNSYPSAAIKVYPGHGPVGDRGIFDADLAYLKDILQAVRSSKTVSEAKAFMVQKYPRWESADFILSLSLKNLFQIANGG